MEKCVTVVENEGRSCVNVMENQGGRCQSVELSSKTKVGVAKCATVIEMKGEVAKVCNCCQKGRWALKCVAVVKNKAEVAKVRNCHRI